VTNPAPPGASASGGYGLAGMCERAAQAGGEVTHRWVEGCFELTLDLPVT
jgi:signal transduction histidine kinase